MGRPATAAEAWDLGFADGYADPEELGSGLTWDGPDALTLNEAYDTGVNAGQRVRAAELGVIAQADAEGYPRGSATNPYRSPR